MRGIIRTRTEAEMMDLILAFARGDERIRGTLLNGSRANPDSEGDIFSDYDIANLVTDVEPFRDYQRIESHFGPFMLVQTPEDNEWPAPIGDGRYNYNMQLADGNRIDLSFFHISRAEEVTGDSLTLVLLDKDGMLPEVPPPGESSYFVMEPTPKLYTDCCTEFFFGLGSHVPKTLWRRDLPLLHRYMDVVLRRPLVMMLGWEAGFECDFRISVGKAGGRLKEHLSGDDWEMFMRTYPDSNFENIWESLKVFYTMFMGSGERVAGHCGYDFPREDGERAWAFLQHVHNLPGDAERIFQ